jgi:nucleotide-binding universal stress UspA family protein
VISIKNILVATDFSDLSDAALMYGKDFARSYGAVLHVVHVANDLASGVSAIPMAVAPDVGTLQMQLEADARRLLDDLLTEEDRRVLRARPVLLTSPLPAETIVSYARDAMIDFIIIGTHGRTGLSRLLLGSVAEHIVRLAPCPVLTVRQPERDFLRPDALEKVAAR